MFSGTLCTVVYEVCPFLLASIDKEL